MTISNSIHNYLNRLGIDYTLLPHDHTETSSMTAEVSNVPGSRVVKAVVVGDGERYMMALLPASHHLRLDELQNVLDREVELVPEEEFAVLFNDCEVGAVPALGMAFGLEVVVDKSLTTFGDLYFEGGDHETLVHLQAKAFEGLVADAVHGHFSRHDNIPEYGSGLRHSNM